MLKFQIWHSFYRPIVEVPAINVFDKIGKELSDTAPIKGYCDLHKVFKNKDDVKIACVGKNDFDSPIAVDSKSINEFSDKHFDLVYINTDRMLEDMVLWWPKLKSSGLLVGHSNGTANAVSKFLASYQCEFTVLREDTDQTDCCWIIVKSENQMDKELLQFAIDHPDLIQNVEVTIAQGAIPDLLESKIWPEAVNQSLIVDQYALIEKERRAKSIISSFLNMELTGKKFLDFGAGDSNCAKAATEKGAIAFAYDITDSDGVITAWDEIKSNGPYDVILLYDVIDHLVDSSGKLLDVSHIPNVVQNITDVLTNDGKVFVRCHPWTSRHGTHAYLNKNRAFIHYHTDEFDGLPTIKIKTPTKTYQDIFAKSGLKIQRENPQRQRVESLFLSNTFASWKNLFPWENTEIYDKVMAVSFIDYILTR